MNNKTNNKKWDLEALTDYIKGQSRGIILQYNKSNTQPLNNLLGDTLPNNLHFLYDASGGRGTEIEKIQAGPITGLGTVVDHIVRPEPGVNAQDEVCKKFTPISQDIPCGGI